MQIHWQFKDGATEMIAQRDINSNEEMREFVKETSTNHPLPDGAIWMACDVNSQHFVCAKKVE